MSIVYFDQDILKHGELIGSQPGSEFGIFHKIKEIKQ